MARLTKNRKNALSKYDAETSYPLVKAADIVKEITNTKFNSSIDVDVRLGVDPRKADQMVRGVVSLPHGTGREMRVLALVSADKEQEAKDAGADYVGLDEMITKIEGGWLEFDVVITMPSTMAKVGKLGRVLGPRNLMPNPKAGTVTTEVGKAIKDVKSGKIDFKVDKFGIIHTSIGRASFSSQQLAENLTELMQTLSKMKPSSAKGTYFKGVSVSSTMSPGVKVDKNSISGI